ncbi:MAG TPA: tetratricopeptide repeat protein [Salinimicrobium sp.]|nr:tetratricopeptide repeat protein [Salinimicrobium sp.]
MRHSVLFLWFFLLSISCFSQSEQLARNYFEQGEFEKALNTYQNLVEKNPDNLSYFYGMIASCQQLEKYDKAEDLLRDKIHSTANRPTLLVELGHNYELRGDLEKAELYYKEALFAVEARPNYAFPIAQTFEKYSLLDQAIKAYETGMQANTNANYNIQLARLYGEQGQIEKMFGNYIDLVSKNPAILPNVRRVYAKFITSDPENKANKIFRKLLLKKLQEQPNVLYNQMLSWLFVQQKDYKMAFLQEKAIFNRSQGNLGRIIQLTMLAREAKNYETALEILDFLISEAKNNDLKLQAHQLQLSIKQEVAEPKKYDEIEKAYRNLFETYGNGLETLALQLDFANFLAFKRDKKEEAMRVLDNLLQLNPNKRQEATLKMALADILVMDEKFNQALIYYSQVQNLAENNEMAQLARFRVAKTSYYKGDFDWAKTQLDVLKSATSQLIANDAMELSLLISDNSIEDTAQTALKHYAKADLLAFQNKNKEAISILEDILVQFKGTKIEDEALLKQAQLFEETGDFAKAEENYLNLIQYHKTGILSDNAHFALAELYNVNLKNPQKAKEFYEKIIFNYPDSIYFVDAREKFRELRGEGVE